MAFLCETPTQICINLLYPCGASGAAETVTLARGITVLSWCQYNMVGAHLNISCSTRLSTWRLPDVNMGGHCEQLFYPDVYDSNYPLISNPTPPYINVLSEEVVLPLLTLTRLGFGERRFYATISESEGMPDYLSDINYTFVI